MALLQPDTPLDFPDLVFIIFYLSHGAMWLAIGHASIALKNRPTLDSVKRVILVSVMTIGLVYVINLLIGPPAHYWYLGARPDSASIMDLLPEPQRHIGCDCFRVNYVQSYLFAVLDLRSSKI